MLAVTNSKKKVRVVVADDHPLYREGVVRALTASGQVEVVAEAGDGRTALAEIQEHSPEVALLDYKLPDLDGVAVVHAVTRDGLGTRVLLLSAFTDSGLVYEALQTGAAGYLPKEAKREQIVDAVLACARGETVVPPELTTGLVTEIRMRRRTTHRPSPGGSARSCA
jgi:two-component system nitrate/nitrite response regulator NarL